MNAEGRREHARRAGSTPKKAPLKLPPLRTPEDAQEALRLVHVAWTRGKVAVAQCRRHEALIALFLKAYEVRSRDFDAEVAELKADLRRKYER
jgi:hypothetical protein